MPPPIDQTEATNVVLQVVTWVLGAMYAALTTLFGLVWKKHNDEITGLKVKLERIDAELNSKVDEESFNRLEARLHGEITALHMKIDEANKDATNRHIELLRELQRYLK